MRGRLLGTWASLNWSYRSVFLWASSLIVQQFLRGASTNALNVYCSYSPMASSMDRSSEVERSSRFYISCFYREEEGTSLSNSSGSAFGLPWHLQYISRNRDCDYKTSRHLHRDGRSTWPYQKCVNTLALRLSHSLNPSFASWISWRVTNHEAV